MSRVALRSSSLPTHHVAAPDSPVPSSPESVDLELSRRSKVPISKMIIDSLVILVDHVRSLVLSTTTHSGLSEPTRRCPVSNMSSFVDPFRVVVDDP